MCGETRHPYPLMFIFFFMVFGGACTPWPKSGLSATFETPLSLFYFIFSHLVYFGVCLLAV